jgi:NAD-dependent DNA ligase
MPSEKLTRILRAKSPLPLDEIEAMSDAEGWDWVYAHASPRKERLPSICFTGFSQVDKDALSVQATDARLHVVGSVNKFLLFLCAGDNAGPAKVAKAKVHGVAILTRGEFAHFLETGEIPM